MIKEDIIKILDNIIEKKKYSNIELNYYFMIKNYSYEQKAFVKNILNEVLKNLIYIDYIIDYFTKNVSKRKIRHLLRISIAQMLFTNADTIGVIYEANEIAKKESVHQSKFVNSVLNKVIENIDKIDKEIDEKALINVKYSYPKWLVDKIKIDFKEDYLEILKSLKKRSYIAVRPNKNKISIDKFYNSLKDDIIFQVEEVFYLKKSKNLSKFKKNEYFIQDAASYIVSKNLDVKEGDIVLDSCSSPGGKACAILSMTNPKVLYATDIYEHKISILEEVKSLYEFENMKIILKDASVENNFYNEYFDKILLDVPCSGLGVIKRKPEKIYNLKLSDIKALKKVQKSIIEANLPYLKKGGILVYSTCTITKNENTNNIKYILEKYDNLEVLDLDIPKEIIYKKDELGGVYLSYENEYLDNFYIIKLRKKR